MGGATSLEPKVEPMERITIDDPRLHDIQRMYMKRWERENKRRASVFVKYNSRNRTAGIFLVGLAASIYGYTIYAIKGDKFGEEFDQRIEDTLVEKLESPKETSAGT